MYYRIEKKEDKWCVVQDTPDKKVKEVSKHDTLYDARKKQLELLTKDSNKGAKKMVDTRSPERKEKIEVEELKEASLVDMMDALDVAEMISLSESQQETIQAVIHELAPRMIKANTNKKWKNIYDEITEIVGYKTDLNKLAILEYIGTYLESYSKGEQINENQYFDNLKDILTEMGKPANKF